MKKVKIPPMVLGYLCATIAYTIWGFSYLFTKTALKVTQPPVILAARYLLAFLSINIVRFIKKPPMHLKRNDVLQLLLLGIANPVVYMYLESYGLLYTTTIFSGVMSAMSPLFSMLLAAVILRELPAKRQCWFSLIPIAGVILITISGKSEGHLSTIGIVCMSLCCIVGSLTAILSRQQAVRYSAFERTYFMMLTGCVVFTGAAIAGNWSTPELLWQPFLEPSFLISVLCLGLLCSVVAFLCFNTATRCLPVATTSIFSNLITLISIFSGAIFLKEPLTPVCLIGSAMIVGGIWLVTRSGNESA